MPTNVEASASPWLILDRPGAPADTSYKFWWGLKKSLSGNMSIEYPCVSGHRSFTRSRHGMTPSNIDTGTLLVTKENAAEFQPVVDSGRGG